MTTMTGQGADAALSGGVLRISTGAVVANWRRLRDLVAPAECAAVMKADAYGLGVAELAPALYAAGCRSFFVALPAEGIALRQVLGADASVYVLNGLMPGTAAEYATAGLVPVLNSLAQLREWNDLARTSNRRLSAVIQLDSGMSRMGLSPAEMQEMPPLTDLSAHLDLRLVMSHLACGDEPGNPANAAQREAFLAASAALPGLRRSLVNSAGCFLGPDYHFELCRPGAALYGLTVSPASPKLDCAVTLEARVTQIRQIPAGAAVGYGYTFRADAPMRLATLGIGYADGWPRASSSRGAAWFDGHRLPILGRVSMDSTVIDISALPDGALTPGDLVQMIGPEQPPEAVGEASDTIGYEIFTRLGRRFHREYTA